jgi:hypothetical protein
MSLRFVPRSGPGVRAAFAVLGLALAAPVVARAQAPQGEDSEAEARRLFEDGVRALQGEDYPTALVAFQRAQALSPRPILVYNIGMCERALFRYPEAMATLRQYLAEAGAEGPADLRQQAEAALAEMEGRLGEVEVRVVPDGARVVVDGHEVGSSPLLAPIRLAPGDHVVEARREGFADGRETVRVMGGERQVVSLSLVQLAALPVGEGGTPGTGGPVPAEDGGGIASQWWFWTILGAVVVGGAVTAGVLLWPEEEAAAAWVIEPP